MKQWKAFIGEVFIAHYFQASDNLWYISNTSAPVCNHFLIANTYKTEEEVRKGILYLVPKQCRQYVLFVEHQPSKV